MRHRIKSMFGAILGQDGSKKRFSIVFWSDFGTQVMKNQKNEAHMSLPITPLPSPNIKQKKIMQAHQAASSLISASIRNEVAQPFERKTE